MFEAVTWTQLGYHSKPSGVLNLHGFYDPMKQMVDRAFDEGFVRPMLRDLLLFGTSVEELLERMAEVELPAIERWIHKT
jgi:predicted Rossmann-fold nucleotide-binding protein